MEEMLKQIGEFFHSEILLANIGVIAMAVLYICKGIFEMFKNRKTVKVEVDNKETNEKLDNLEKQNSELKDELSKTNNLLMLMIRHSKLSDEAKVKAEDIHEGKKVDTTKEEVIIESNETSKSVVEKLSSELNK